MIKHIAAILGLSILVILAMPYAHEGLKVILTAHEWVADTLTDVFSGGKAGNLIRQLLALLAIPVVAGLIPAIVFWLARRRWFPYFMEVVWVIWLVQAAAIIIPYQAAAT